jgi:DNA ligase-1
VSLLQFEFRAGGLHLPRLGLWLDPHEPQLGPEKVFVSHAHSDHVAAHRAVILSAPTARLMQARVPGTRQEDILPFRETRSFEWGGATFQLTLLPAGHIFGSAMALLQAGGQSLLFTGDFKLRAGRSAEPCEPRPAELLVMETTFGRPQYTFPPTAAVMAGVTRFCREALDNDETPVLLGYSLGKSQEVLCGLADAGLNLMLHGAVYKLTRIYEQFRQCFPPYERYEAGSTKGKVLLCPPNVINSALLRNLGRTRTAILTGWAVDPNCRYRYQCDAAFPLSDHADFPDLLELVTRVQPGKIYTLHGFAAEFAQTLRDLGYDARALSQNEQLALALESESRLLRSEQQKDAEPQNENQRAPCSGLVIPTVRGSLAQTPQPVLTASPLAADCFLNFAQTCARIAADTRKLEKIRLLAEYLRGLTGSDLALAPTWFTGRPFPPGQNKTLQVGWAVLRDSLCAAAGVGEPAFRHVYLKHSDVGETATELLQSAPAGQSRQAPTLSSLSLQQVAELFAKLEAARGPSAKAPLLEAVLSRCTGLEAKYLVKIITGDLRIGLKEGLVEEALANAFATTPEAIRKANLLLGDIGETARLAAEKRLGEATVVSFRPIKFMLASPEPTAADVWQRMQSVGPARARLVGTVSGQAGPADAPAGGPALVWLEDKYDGVRSQLHKVGQRVALYSRDLKEITTTFLELADSARGMSGDFILDGEIVAMRSEEVLPFAELQKRLGRRQGDLFMRNEVPIQFVAFDLLWSGGKSLLDCPLSERRRALESLSPWATGLRLAHITQADSAQEIDRAFSAARTRGNEGLMIKDPASAYAPGRRGLAWLKLKQALATLDCVVVGAEYGHGKRGKVLSDYTFAVRDERTGDLKTIGKAYTGLTDAEIAALTQHFLSTAVRQHGRYFEVQPDTVLEIAFDKIQRSGRHNSGLALRFPRIVRVRTDKPVAEIDTLAAARRLVEPRDE